MRPTRLLSLAAWLLGPGCGASGDSNTTESATATTTAGDTFPTSDSDATDTDTDTATATATDTGDGDGDGDDPVSVCVTTCTSAADCDLGGGLALDADNYTCLDGGCVYTGCNEDAECQPTGQLCRAFDGATLSTCTMACAVADDCTGVGGAYDADNWDCDGGACRYIGCNTDAECSDPVPGQVCHAGAVDTCTAACSTVADCPLSEQFECVDGGCVYRGCRDDASCSAGFVCRG